MTGHVPWLVLSLSASNVSHTVVLRPLKAGYFNFTSATVSYLAQEGGQVVVSVSFLASIYVGCFYGKYNHGSWKQDML